MLFEYVQVSALRLLTTSPCRTLCLQTAEALQQSSYKSGKTSRRILTISGGWGPGGRRGDESGRRWRDTLGGRVSGEGKGQPLVVTTNSKCQIRGRKAASHSQLTLGGAPPSEKSPFPVGDSDSLMT